MKRRILAAVLMGVPVLLAAVARGDDPIDWNRARVLHREEVRGVALSREDQAYLDRAKAARGEAGAATEPVARASTGLVPLTDLKGTAMYKGEVGGLYPGGRNEPPEGQLRLAVAAAKQVVPRDAKGVAAAGGKIVMLSIGMSNTTQEFSVFEQRANGDAEKSPAVLIVDGAQGGQDAAAWTKGEASENPVWKEALARIGRAGATPAQVQVVWIKQALAQPAKYGEFPASAKALQKDLAETVRAAKAAFVNLQIVYVSSRTYGGYATGPLNPEPFAYEGAFAVRGLIEEQMGGEAALNADPAKGAVAAPVVMWGPYLWADGSKPRGGDGLVWLRSDFGPDGTHPNGAGREKVAGLLLGFFKTDLTAKGWFVKGAG